MLRPVPVRASVLVLGLLGTLWPGGRTAADAPAVRELRIQKRGETVYFHVRLAAPADLEAPGLSAAGVWAEGRLRGLSGFPQLVPQDRQTRAVYPRLALPAALPGEVRLAGREGLEFVGRWPGTPGRSAQLLLLYRAGKGPAPGAAPDPPKSSPFPGLPPEAWREAPVTLDPTAARQLPDGDELRGLWAAAQAADFAVREAQAGESSFPGFARAATGRKYGVPAPSLLPPPADDADYRRLYQLVTGSEAIADVLQLRRRLGPEASAGGARTVPVGRLADVPGPEHPWPGPGTRLAEAEVLARWVPADNYAIHFKDFRKFLDFDELLDRWGAPALGLYLPHSRDHQVRRRYEKQLCLRDTPFVRQFGSTVVRRLVVTGSDPYLAEGSDVTTVFRVTNAALFRNLSEPFIQEARQEFGKDLKEAKTEYHGVTIESYVSPLREVSLYRAAVEDVVIHANSPVALRRALDAGHGRAKALAATPEYRHVRALFPPGDRDEDGFAFLPEAFLRAVVGPASKIKEKRRREALTSLRLVSYGALFAAWEGGGRPADQGELLAAAALKPEDVATPDGTGAVWDVRRRVAVSDVYGTLRFATPLLELPIDKVTPGEASAYDRFRRDYLAQGLRYLDPVAVRLTLNDREVRVRMYLVPLVESSRYAELRHWTGSGTMPAGVPDLPATTLVGFGMHLSPALRAFITRKEDLGDWFFFRLEDSALYGRLARVRALQELRPEAFDAYEQQAEQLFFGLPLLAGVKMGDARGFDTTLHSFADLLNLVAGPFAEEAVRPAYRGVTISRARFDPNSGLARSLNNDSVPPAKRFVPVLYHGRVEGAWYASFSEAALKEQIDRATERPPVRATERPGGTEPAKAQAPAGANEALYVAPKAAVQAREGLGFFLEWESHKRALANAPLWHVLFRCGLLGEQPTERELREAALRYFGYVPLPPDGSTYRYDARTDEVVNSRHGTRRQPVLHEGVDAKSLLGQLLEEFRSVRAELRLGDEGLHTMVTIERQGRR
jgi:hypothetical protein